MEDQHAIHELRIRRLEEAILEQKKETTRIQAEDAAKFLGLIKHIEHLQAECAALRSTEDNRSTSPFTPPTPDLIGFSPAQSLIIFTPKGDRSADVEQAQGTEATGSASLPTRDVAPEPSTAPPSPIVLIGAPAPDVVAHLGTTEPTKAAKNVRFDLNRRKSGPRNRRPAFSVSKSDDPLAPPDTPASNASSRPKAVATAKEAAPTSTPHKPAAPLDRFKLGHLGGESDDEEEEALAKTAATCKPAGRKKGKATTRTRTTHASPTAKPASNMKASKTPNVTSKMSKRRNTNTLPAQKPADDGNGIPGSQDGSAAASDEIRVKGPSPSRNANAMSTLPKTTSKTSTSTSIAASLRTPRAESETASSSFHAGEGSGAASRVVETRRSSRVATLRGRKVV